MKKSKIKRKRSSVGNVVSYKFFGNEKNVVGRTDAIQNIGLSQFKRAVTFSSKYFKTELKRYENVSTGAKISLTKQTNKFRKLVKGVKDPEFIAQKAQEYFSRVGKIFEQFNIETPTTTATRAIRRLKFNENFTSIAPVKKTQEQEIPVSNFPNQPAITTEDIEGDGISPDIWKLLNFINKTELYANGSFTVDQYTFKWMVETGILEDVATDIVTDNSLGTKLYKVTPTREFYDLAKSALFDKWLKTKKTEAEQFALPEENKILGFDGEEDIIK